jgi:hypothetical protein
MTANDQSHGPAKDAGMDTPQRSTAIRRDRGQAPQVSAGGDHCHEAPVWHHFPRLHLGLGAILLILMVVFSAIPMTIDLRGKPNKDYSLWYQVGVAIRQGIDIYPDPATGRLFPFMYPPSAAAMLGFISVLGKHGSTLVLVLGHSAAWIGAIILSTWLATGGRASRQHPFLYVLPSLCIIALIHNTYLLGQPNLSLLTLLLGAFACLRIGRQSWAGILIATATAIKAFPILALGYLVYRRMWRATAITLLSLALWLLVVPLCFRTPEQAVRDVAVWSRGMVFTYNAQGIAQRPFRSFSYKNQSIMAMAHRLFRDVPADGEKVLSEHLASTRQAQKVRGNLADRPIDLITMLTAPVELPGKGEVYAGVEPAMKQAWRINILALDFRAVTAVTLAGMFALSLFVVAALPARNRRTPQTDAIEFALITLLIVMFSPLSFNYAYVWLIYPLTVGLNLVLNHPSSGGWRSLEIAWISAALLIPSLAVFMPLYAQAYGNLFFPAMLLVIGLGLKLRGIVSQLSTVSGTTVTAKPLSLKAPDVGDAVGATR